MKKYENLVISPTINQGKIYDGYTTEKETNFFGKEKLIRIEKRISEQEWLDRKGQEGWELVAVLRNGMSFDLKDYYFKREISNL